MDSLRCGTQDDPQGVEPKNDPHAPSRTENDTRDPNLIDFEDPHSPYPDVDDGDEHHEPTECVVTRPGYDGEGFLAPGPGCNPVDQGIQSADVVDREL